MRECRVFWPLHCTKEPGYIVGWSTRRLFVCVAAVINEDLDVLNQALALFRSYPGSAKVINECGAEPLVVGQYFPLGAPPRRGPTRLPWALPGAPPGEGEHPSCIADVHLTASPTPEGFPTLREVYCCEYRFETRNQVVFFRPPRSHDRLALDPLSLDLEAQPSPRPPDELTDLELALRQITWTPLALRLLDKCLALSRTDPAVPARMPPSRGVAPHATPAPRATVYTPLPPPARPAWITALIALGAGLWGRVESVAAQLLFFLSLLVWAAARGVRSLARVRVPMPPARGRRTRHELRSISAVVRQLDYRLHTIALSPWQWLRFRRAKPTPAVQAGYHSCLNHALVLVLDGALGIIALLWVRSDAPTVLAMLHYCVDTVVGKNMRRHITWLMGWPAGLKLNDNLDLAMGTFFNFANNAWSSLLDLLVAHERGIARMFACVGVLGFTMLLALAEDVIALLTLHIRWMHAIASGIFSTATYALLALLRLFRGKKRNVLRGRTDSCEYEADELLLGTLLFSLLLFLLPTLAAYHALFVLSRFLVALLCGAFRCATVVVAWCPLYSALLALLSPRKLAGGISLHLMRCDKPLDAAHPLRSCVAHAHSTAPAIIQSSGPTLVPTGSPFPAPATPAHPDTEARRSMLWPARSAGLWAQRRLRSFGARSLRGLARIGRRAPHAAPPPTVQTGVDATTYLYLQSRPMPFSSVLAPYGRFVRVPMRWIAALPGCLLGGRALPDPAVLPNPTVPAELPSLLTYWLFLKTHLL